MRFLRLFVTSAMLAGLLAGCGDKPGGPAGGPPGGGPPIGPPPPAPGEILAAGVADPGEAVYVQWCSSCHAPLPKPGERSMGRFPPAGSAELQRRYGGKIPATLTDRTDLTAAAIRSVVRKGQGIMPPSRKSEITDEELDKLTAWLTRKNR